jgi:glycosyltransferase involved in cell wall biosynthesis
MTMRVLVVSGDVLPLPGYSTSGAGLRAWGLGQGLRANGFDVVFAMPSLGRRSDVALPELDFELRYWDADPAKMEALIRQVRVDAVLFCHWPAVQLRRRLDVPTVIDFHGPHMLERAFQQVGQMPASAADKISAIRKADYFICAGEKQKPYFLAWLIAGGVDVTQPCIDVVPVCLSPELPGRLVDDGAPRFVYGGVYLPWQDPTLGLQTVAAVLSARQYGELHIYGGHHPAYPIDVPPVFQQLEAHLSDNPRVIFEGIRPRDELIEAYRRSAVAVDLMTHNYERELAFTTRTVEYMWCGLPVIYNNYAELSPLITDYQAGWTLDPLDKAGVEQVVHEVLSRPEIVWERGRNAQRLVRERLTWDRAIRPLVDFLRAPRVSVEPRPDLVTYFVHDVDRVLTRWRDAETRPVRRMFLTSVLLYRKKGLNYLLQESLAFIGRAGRSSAARPG